MDVKCAPSVSPAYEVVRGPKPVPAPSLRGWTEAEACPAAFGPWLLAQLEEGGLSSPPPPRSPEPSPALTLLLPGSPAGKRLPAPGPECSELPIKVRFDLLVFWKKPDSRPLKLADGIRCLGLSWAVEFLLPSVFGSSPAALLLVWEESRVCILSKGHAGENSDGRFWKSLMELLSVAWRTEGSAFSGPEGMFPEHGPGGRDPGRGGV